MLSEEKTRDSQRVEERLVPVAVLAVASQLVRLRSFRTKTAVKLLLLTYL